jgi:aspartate 1-decarboxylase
MVHTLLKSKLHQATVTEANLHYEGSCTIDMDLVDAADMMLHEQVHIANINNGERFVTYIIPGERGSGTICLNGACARLAQVGDEIIIMTYSGYEEAEARIHSPKVLVLNKHNKIKA